MVRLTNADGVEVECMSSDLRPPPSHVHVAVLTDDEAVADVRPACTQMTTKVSSLRRRTDRQSS